MAITVHPDGSVDVTAPEGTDPKDIEARVLKRGRWIVRQRMYFDQFRPRTKARRYVGGETHLYLGRQYRLKIVKSDCEQVKLKDGFLIVSLPRRRSSSRVKDLVTTWYADKAKTRILDRYQKIAYRFFQLAPIIRKMSRRWGSHSKTGRVLLNPDLIRAPATCIDYVITHELVHMVHRHHARPFFEMLENLMPDWMERKSRLESMLA
jgi:predicted metal-dependent hydrolase